MDDQQIQRCEFILSKSGSEHTRCAYPVSAPTEVQWDGYSYTLYLCDSHATRFKAALGLLNHPSQPPLPIEDSKRLDESASLSQSGNDRHEEENAGEDKETGTVCDMCGKIILPGRPVVRIRKSIGSEEVNPENNRDEIEVVEDQVLLEFCGHCGNRFDTDAMVKLARELPPTSE